MTLNTVDNLEQFITDINNGHWDVVMSTISTLRFPPAKLVNLFEQVCILFFSPHQNDNNNNNLKIFADIQGASRTTRDRHSKRRATTNRGHASIENEGA